jgi:hypothetical protein
MAPPQLITPTPEQMRRRRRLTLELLWVCTIALVPWAIYLGIALPRNYNAKHWDLAWSGFDGLEILALGATAYYGWRGRQALIATALAAATLLICDAWFDVSLDLGTPAVWGSLASAVFLELPLAFFLIHRVRLLLRITLMHLFPEGDEKGRPMSLSRLPLLATLTGPGWHEKADSAGEAAGEVPDEGADEGPEAAQPQPREPDGP